MKISAKNALWCFAGAVLTIFCDALLLFLNKSNFEGWLLECAVVVLGLFAADTFFLIKCRFRIFSIAYIFVVFSFVFHFGQVLVHVFVKNYRYISEDYLVIYSSQITKTALLLSLNVIQIVVSMMILIGTAEVRKLLDSRRILDILPGKGHISKQNAGKMGWLITAITVPMKTAYTLAAMKAVRSDSYGSIVEGYSGIYIQISNFVIIGFVLLLMSFQGDTLKQVITLGAECVYLLWTMMSGGRLYGMITIIIVVYVFVKTASGFSKKNYVILLLLAVPTLQFVSAISHIRFQKDFSFAATLKYAFDPSNSLVMQLLDEFGSTIYTVIASIDQIPKYLDYHYGGSYWKAFALCGINIHGNLDSIKESVEYTVLFSRNYSFGGTYIGELYYNFGYACFLFALPLGFGVTMISNRFDEALSKKDIYRTIMLVLVIYGILMWVRGYFDGFARQVVWGWIFILLFKKLVTLYRFEK